MLIRASTREKVSLRSEKCLYSTHRRRNRPRQRPPDDNESQKGKKSPYWYSDIIFIEENAPQTNVKARYFNKKRRANAILKKVYLYRAENMKKLQKFCVKIVSLPYFY